MARFDYIVLTGFLVKSSLNGVWAEIEIKAGVTIIGDEGVLASAVACVKMLSPDFKLVRTFPNRDKVPLIRPKKIVKEIQRRGR